MLGEASRQSGGSRLPMLASEPANPSLPALGSKSRSMSSNTPRTNNAALAPAQTYTPRLTSARTGASTSGSDQHPPATSKANPSTAASKPGGHSSGLESGGASSYSSPSTPVPPFSSYGSAKLLTPRPLSTTDNSVENNVGLDNLGNTCFMNSMLQCLLASQHLTSSLLSISSVERAICSSSPSKGMVVKAMIELVHAVHKGKPKSSFVPRELKRVVGTLAPHFSGYQQQDCQEFLRFLLDGLSEDLNRSKRRQGPQPARPATPPDLSERQQAHQRWQSQREVCDSPVTDVFQGQLRSTVECQTCSHVSYCFDPFLDVSVPIPKHAEQVEGRARLRALRSHNSCSLVDCFAAFTDEEYLDGENMYTCEKCKKKRQCVKQLKIHRWPLVLVVHVKRFQYTALRRDKITTPISLPSGTIDLTPFVSHPEDAKELGPPVYDLFGVCNHMGGLGGGHYTATCKHGPSGKWLYFNDSAVTLPRESEPGGVEPYVFFFKQREGVPLLGVVPPAGAPVEASGSQSHNTGVCAKRNEAVSKGQSPQHQHRRLHYGTTGRGSIPHGRHQV